MKTFIIIISGQRHSTTALCDKINSLDNHVSLYELFNQSQTKYKIKEFNNIENILKNVSSDYTEDIISFKIFPNHLNSTQINNICKLKNIYNLKVVILTRHLQDSYISKIYAEIYNDWATNNNKINKQHFIHFKKKFNNQEYNHILDFNKYKKTHLDFFKSSESVFNKYNIPIQYLTFNEHLQPTFNINNFLI